MNTVTVVLCLSTTPLISLKQKIMDLTSIFYLDLVDVSNSYPTMYVVLYLLFYWKRRDIWVNRSISVQIFFYTFFSLHFSMFHNMCTTFPSENILFKFLKRKINLKLYFGIVCTYSILNSIMLQPMSEAFTLYGTTTIYLFSFENQPVDRQ